LSARATRERAQRFCRAFAEETGSRPQRWASIASVAARMGIDQEEAEATAAELAATDLVKIGGGHSVTLTEAGCSSPPANRACRW